MLLRSQLAKSDRQHCNVSFKIGLAGMQRVLISAQEPSPKDGKKESGGGGCGLHGGPLSTIFV